MERGKITPHTGNRNPAFQSFRRYIMPVYSALKRDVVHLLETLVTIRKDTQCRSGRSGDIGGGCVVGNPDVIQRRRRRLRK
jgi:hypothetical protein